MYWLFIHIRTIPCYRETTDATLTVCVIYSLLGLDNVPMNIYVSFDYTLVIIYWSVDNYGYQFWQQIFVLYRRNTFTMCTKLERTCVECVYSIKKYDILIVPLHLFHDDAHCPIDNNHVETLAIWEKCRAIQGVTTNIDSVKPVSYAQNNNHWETQSSLWTFVRHQCFMKYLLNKEHDECTYKGWSEGMATHAWMPDKLLGSTCVQCPLLLTWFNFNPSMDK